MARVLIVNELGYEIRLQAALVTL